MEIRTCDMCNKQLKTALYSPDNENKEYPITGIRLDEDDDVFVDARSTKDIECTITFNLNKIDIKYGNVFSNKEAAEKRLAELNHEAEQKAETNCPEKEESKNFVDIKAIYDKYGSGQKMFYYVNKLGSKTLGGNRRFKAVMVRVVEIYIVCDGIMLKCTQEDESFKEHCVRMEFVDSFENLGEMTYRDVLLNGLAFSEEEKAIKAAEVLNKAEKKMIIDIT